MRKRVFSLSIVSLFAVLALVACGSPSEEIEPTVTRIPDAANAPVLTPTGEAADEAASPVVAAGDATAADAAGEDAVAADVTVVSYDIYFEPTEFTIASGETVTVSLPNEGAAPHNFAIDELDISVDLAPGETKSVDINAEPGVYEYYCNVPGHREAGMVGTLTVT